MGPPGDYQGAPYVGNHRPVEGQETHAQSRGVAEQAVHHDVGWSNPAHPVEHAQAGPKEPREPIPHEAANSSDKEESLPRHVVLLPDAIGLMQGIEERRVDKGSGPDHTGRPHQELSCETSNRISHDLRRQDDHDLVAKPEGLPVEQLLRKEEIGRISTPLNDLGHDGDNSVFLYIEGTRVERPGVTKGFELCRGEDPLEELAHGEGNQLRNDTAD